MKKTTPLSDPIELHGNCLFVSDAHFRTPPDTESEERELKLVQLLKSQNGNLHHFFLLGDIFDYWFEYRDVVPKGYVTLFAYLKELYAQGTQIHYFTGNHDMWVEDYFTQTFGATVHHEARLVDINGHRCFVGHGDGLGGRQRKYLLIKRIFNSKFNQRLYSMLHPRQSSKVRANSKCSSPVSCCRPQMSNSSSSRTATSPCAMSLPLPALSLTSAIGSVISATSPLTRKTPNLF